MSSQEPVAGGSNPIIEQLERGDVREAERLAREAVAQAEKAHGASSAQYANAQHDLGMVFGAVGDVEKAIEAFQKACAVTSETDDAIRAPRLTYLLSLGNAFYQAEKFDEAEKALRDSAEGTKAILTAEHPNYGFAMEQLSQVLSTARKHDEAVAAAETAYATLYRAGHPGVASALVGRAYVLRAAGKEQAPFMGLATVPKTIIEHIVAGAINDSPQRDPELAVHVLAEVRKLSESRLGKTHPATLHALAATSSAARAAGKAEVAFECLREMITGLEAVNEHGEAARATLELADAQCEAGDLSTAMDTLKDAAKRGEAHGIPSARAGAQRRIGALLAHAGNKSEAEKALREAVANAKKDSEDPEELGRSSVALGVFLQHEARKDEAQALLEQAVRVLPRRDPEALVAFGHLKALMEDKPCRCGG